MKGNQPEIEATDQDKSQDEFTAVSNILTRNFNEIEDRSRGYSVAGIPVNFYDFDAMTQGLQRGDLIVLGSRPSMGKTSLALNMAKNVAQLHNLPVCIFDLEMSKEQLTYRLISSEVGIETSRLRTGRLQEDEWPDLGEGLERLGQLPIFITDQSKVTVDEMISNCLLYTSPSPRDQRGSRMPSSA